MRLNAFFSGATFFAIIYPTEMIMIAKINHFFSKIRISNRKIKIIMK